MPDLQLYDELDGLDILVQGGEPIMDNGLGSSAFLSLVVELSESGGPGWWGCLASSDIEQPIGSRISFIKKNNAENRARATECIKECFSWMVDQGAAKEINVEIEEIKTMAVLFRIEITKPDFTIETQKYSLNWENQEVKKIAVS